MSSNGGGDICFTVSVVNERQLAAGCFRHLRRAYPSSWLVLLADTDDPRMLEHWFEYGRTDPRTRVVPTGKRLYAIENGGLVVSAHLKAFLETDANWWFKIDPDTFVRRSIKDLPRDRCFFGTIQGGNPRPSLQGGCIGGVREAAQEMYGSSILDSPELLRHEESWAGNNPILLRRVREKGLVSFDFVLAWACEQLGIPIVDHPEIKSLWLGPPRNGRQYAITHPHKDLDALDPDVPDAPTPLVQRLRMLLLHTVPRDAVVTIVSRGDDALLEVECRKAWHFPQHERGCYLGHHPADSDEAVRHLEAVQRKGAQFLVIPAPSFWWLDHYRGFREYLEQNYRRITWQEDTCLVFDLTRPPTGDRVAVSVVMGFRDWLVDHLALAVKAHLRGSLTGDIEIIVVDYGSSVPDTIRQTVEAAGGRVIRVDAPGRWNRAAALNVGIRKEARGDYIITTDADILFGPRTIETVLRAVKSRQSKGGVYALVQCRDLPPSLPVQSLEDLPWDLMRDSSTLRPRWGMGGCAWFPRWFIEEVRGYDERLEWWGAEDNDLCRRAERFGLDIVWVDDVDAHIYHMWHERALDVNRDDPDFQKIWERNQRISKTGCPVYRNPQQWGGLPSSPAAVSVLADARTHAKSLRDAIASVLNQTFENFELLVVDDGSDAAVRQILEEFDDPRVRYIYQATGGVTGARDRVVGEARGKLIVTMNDGGPISPTCLQSEWQAFNKEVVGC